MALCLILVIRKLKNMLKTGFVDFFSLKLLQISLDFGDSHFYHTTFLPVITISIKSRLHHVFSCVLVFFLCYVLVCCCFCCCFHRKNLHVKYE